jgi:ribosomal protein S6E (S10)
MGNIRLTTIILLALNVTGCATAPTVTLSWDEQVKSVYRITREAFPREMALDIDAMLANPEVMQAKIAELKTLELDPRTFPMRMTLKGSAAGRIEVLTKNAKVAYANEATDENERRQRKIQEKTVGLVQLNTAIDRQGKNLNPYLKNGQANMVAMIFRLPGDPVALGDSWRLPLVLSTLNTPFLADETRRDNRVWINAVSERPGVGKVAEIVYLVREKIEGKRQLSIKDTPEPFVFNSSYFAVGEFAVDKQRWLRYIGRLDVAALGLIRSVDLVALLPECEAKR